MTKNKLILIILIFLNLFFCSFSVKIEKGTVNLKAISQKNNEKIRELETNESNEEAGTCSLSGCVPEPEYLRQ